MNRRYGSTFVAPDPKPRRVEIVEVERELPVASSPVLLPHAGYEDRARGFRIATLPLAVVVGCVTALAAVIGWAVPVASLVTLLLGLAGFCLTWLAAYLGFILISPDGALFAHTFWMWYYLRVEQRERHARLQRMVDHDDD